MLAMAVRNTKKLVRRYVASDKIRLGRYFTGADTAATMAASLCIPEKETVRVLDPGAGTGILSAAIIEEICQAGGVFRIELTAYENDPRFLPMLRDNLERIRKKCRHDYGVRLAADVREADFFTVGRGTEEPAAEGEESYDLILAAPPTGRPAPGSLAEETMNRLCPRGTDVSFIFAECAAALLAPGGQMSVRLPASFANGAHAAPVRRRLFGFAPLIFLSLAADADGKMKKDLFCSVRRGELPEEVEVRAIRGNRIEDLPPIPYHVAVYSEECKVLLPKKLSDLRLIRAMQALPCRFSDFGLVVRNGLTIETRYPECLRSSRVDGAIPLLHPAGLRGAEVLFPAPGREKPYIVPRIPSLAQPNRTMLLVKRVPVRSDGRRLVVGVYYSGQLPHDRQISTANKFLCIEAESGEMDAAFATGLAAVLSSSYYERYCALTDTIRRVNVSSLQLLPLPDRKTLASIGQRLLVARNLSLRVLDTVAGVFLAPFLGAEK